MKVLYTRVSTENQNSDRQKIGGDFDLVLEDNCSGTIPLFERPRGMELKSLIEKGNQITLKVWDIDRLGRDLRDILNSIHFCTEKNICIEFVNQGLKTITNGKENPLAKMMISILGTIGEMNKKQINQNTRQGIAIAKGQGKYKGRKPGSIESNLEFLSKPRNQKIIDLLRKGNTIRDISLMAKCSTKTIIKVKKLNSI